MTWNCGSCQWVNNIGRRRCSNCSTRRTAFQNVAYVRMKTLHPLYRQSKSDYRYRNRNSSKVIPNVQTFSDGTAWG